MKYLYIIYQGHVLENLCEEYTGRWDKNKPHQDNKIRYHFYKNFPPPLLHTYRGNYKNCESHSRGSPPTFFSPAGWRRKSKNKFEL